MSSTNGDDSLHFHDLPPFPDDVPTAPLRRLSLQKLISGDTDEIDRLWDSCVGAGFFYLDLRGALAQDDRIDGDALLADSRTLFDVASKVFDLPVEEKQKYDLSGRGLYFGYKGLGAALLDKQGTRDRNEQYYISKDDMLDQTPPLPSPPALLNHKALLAKYIHNAHAITLLILTHLNTRLGLPPNTLPSLHRLEAPSGDQVRFVRSPPQPPSDRKTALGAHTDFGSVTLLFNRLGGLQIPALDASMEDFAREDAWVYVRPLVGHCIVNLGDALVKFTRGILRSSVHRVVNPPGEQGDCVRYSVVYFSRPEDDVVLKALEGSAMIEAAEYDDPAEEMTSKQWTLKRGLARRKADTFDEFGGTEGMRREGGKTIVSAPIVSAEA